ncbi:MAG TPA: diacylglycerol kinase family protein [Anaerolineae bacterium]|nr:diacylglycerol kinase family protein [Anaerolineae bacterium]HMR65211.1 diacylglycerol kinase family protein [Anaerolineae bacterium]
MQATVIYNRNANGANQITPDEIKTAFHKLGFDPVYKLTSSQQDLDPILAETDEGLVVVAGGDGTFRAVATRLIGKNLLLTIVPLGTANNIARALQIHRTPKEIFQGLNYPVEYKFDVGYMRGPWGEDYFLEGAGFGLFADMLVKSDPSQGKSILRSAQAIFENFIDHATYYPKVAIDGEEISEAHLLVEVLNTPAIGPRLKFAPEADPSDGLFDVVRIRKVEHENLLSYTKGLFFEELPDYDGVELSRAKRIDVHWTGFAFHIDGEVRPEQPPKPVDQDPAFGARPTTHGPTDDSMVTIEILPGALTLWLPTFG